MKNKILVLILLLMLITPVYAKDFDNNINLVREDYYDVSDAGSFSIYYKDINGKYNYYDTFSFDKKITKKTFNINKMIYGIKIVKNSGYELNLDEVTINGKTDNNYIKKLKNTDNDVIEVEDELYLDITGSGEMIISGRSPLTLKGTKYAFKFPENSNYLEYEINSNYGDYNNYLFYHLDNVITGSGHPTAPMDYYVSNDDEFLYIYTKAYIDNTFDHGKDYSKVYIKTSEGIKSYQVNTIENNKYGEWYFKYTNNSYNINWEHMEYLIKVPLKDIKDEKVGLLFEYYGTASCFSGYYPILKFSVKDDSGNPIKDAKFQLEYLTPEPNNNDSEEGLVVTSDEKGNIELILDYDEYYYEFDPYIDYIEDILDNINNTKIKITQISAPEGYTTIKPQEVKIKLDSIVDEDGEEYDNLEELDDYCNTLYFTFNLVDEDNNDLVVINTKINENKPIPENPKTLNQFSIALFGLIIITIISSYMVISKKENKKD